MTAYPAWTPASRPGIIPLHPLSFGTILGRSFAALRHNPRVLLGFALGVQTVSYLLLVVGVSAVALAAFVRLDTVPPGSDDFGAIMAGSIAVTAIAAFVLGAAAGALGVIVQGVVVSEVAHAALAEKLTLRLLWQRVKPVLWRLIGYALMLTIAVLLLIAAVVGILVAIGFAALPIAIALSVLAVLAAIPIALWLSTKLLLVPATIILEHATIRQAIIRSWQLIRGRFWAALGVIVIISVIFGFVGQVVSLPFTFLSGALGSIITPTGDPDTGAIIAVVVGGLLTQVVTLAIQSVAVVVQATATSLIYIDCRMRREGLDLDLLAYVEKRDAGATALSDPYRENVGRQIAPRPSAPAYAAGPYRPGSPPPPGAYQPAVYGTAAGYAAPPLGYGTPPARYGAAPRGYPPPGYSAPPPTAFPPPAASPPTDPSAPTPPPAAVPPPPGTTTTGTPPTDPTPTRWTAPGEPADGTDRHSPWA